MMFVADKVQSIHIWASFYANQYVHLLILDGHKGTQACGIWNTAGE